MISRRGPILTRRADRPAARSETSSTTARGRPSFPGLYQTLEEGFFFEIVERRGYSGFGAVNAPIRLAAQTRLAPNPAVSRL